MTPDAELLRHYSELDSEEAFAELVRRHLDLVYSTALRVVNGDAHLAKDVAQIVFTDLARKASKLSHHPALSGWLYTSAHFAACNAARKEQRRRAREQEAQTMHELLQSSPGADWERVRPVLDTAMHKLKERERTAVLMRYFENRPFADIGAQLGLSEDAARKRVERALNRLQKILSKRGITTSAALSAVICANAVQSAPAGLAATLTSTSLSGAAATSGTISAIAKLMAATKIQTTTVCAILLASAIAPLAIHQRARGRLLEQDDTLQKLNDQLTNITSENLRLGTRFAEAQKRTSHSDPQLQELLKLRSEAGTLRHVVEQLKQPSDLKALSPKDKLAELKARYAFQVSRLKQWIQDHPAESIPELANAQDSRWINAVTSLEKDDDFERAASNLRGNMELDILSQLSRAGRDYQKANSGESPTTIAQLEPFLKSPIDDSILQRYLLLSTSTLPEEVRQKGDWIVTEAAPVNPELDGRFYAGPKGGGTIQPGSNAWNLPR